MKTKLEEAAELYSKNISTWTKIRNNSIRDFIAGAKWQKERMYSEEEVLKLLKSRTLNLYINIPMGKHLGTEKWFEQFKKK